MAPRTRASAGTASVPQQLSSPPKTPARRQRQAPSKQAQKVTESTKKTGPIRKRARASESDDKVADELPHNLGPIATPEASDEASDIKKEESSPPAKKRPRHSPKDSKIKAEPEEAKNIDQKAKLATPAEPETAEKPKAKKKKAGFAPGETPYPDWPHPTPEECYEVERILSKAHGKVKAPDVIPVPSTTVAGCGEVPSVLDALIRTRLSAATTGKNSSTAFQGLVKAFGTIKEGIGKGSVDWNAVRLASQPQVYQAIKAGGMGDVKSKDIKAILDMVYKENQARKDRLKQSKQEEVAGAKNESSEEQESEIARAENEVISLDHLHLLDTSAAMARLQEFPGIGFKTASCVALFCLRRPSFAVDTHVFRLVQYLSWVPPPNLALPKGQPKVGRDTAYFHCEARVPDDLKYPLHQLLIKHGKTCPRCRAATTTSSAEWKKGCPIEHLVSRFEAKKGGGESLGDGASATPKTKSKAKAKTAKGKKGGRVGTLEHDEDDDEEEEEAESSGVSTASSDSEIDEDDDDDNDDGKTKQQRRRQPVTQKRTPMRRAAKANATTKIKAVEKKEEEDESGSDLTSDDDLSSAFEE